jgi:hypothetical protein
MLRVRLVAALFVVVAAPGMLRAQGQPEGPEFRVNTYTTNGQLSSSIALDAIGNFVIVWESANGQDGSSGGIFGQRYASTGAPLGAEFRVNTYTTNLQLSPRVASDYDGNFVVAWSSAATPQNENFDIFAQRYDAAGVPLGGEFRINTHTTSNQFVRAVASDPAGNVVVVWQSWGQDGSADGIFAQRYSSTGEPMGGEFQVNSYTPHSQSGASVAMDALGNFVVVWNGTRSVAAGWDIFGRRYSSSGMPLGFEFRVNTYTSNDQVGPVIASNSAGDFVVVWQGKDGSQGGIFGQRYSSSGSKLGAEFRVNTSTAFNQYIPAVASDPDGNFVVAWQGQNPAYLDVFAQRYSSSGVPLGGPWRVNTYVSTNQIYPAMSTDAAGNYVVTWTSSWIQDGSGPGIYAQRYNMILR